jgi:hypothetical protein
MHNLVIPAQHTSESAAMLPGEHSLSCHMPHAPPTPPPTHTCCKAQDGLAAAQEQLQHSDGRAELARRHVPQVADGARCLKDDHLRLVPQARLQEVVEGARLTVGSGLAVRNDLHRKTIMQRALRGQRFCVYARGGVPQAGLQESQKGRASPFGPGWLSAMTCSWGW